MPTDGADETKSQGSKKSDKAEKPKKKPGRGPMIGGGNLYLRKEREIPIDLEIIKRNIKENGNPHITGTQKLFMNDPSQMLAISKGALLRNHSSTILKNGGPSDFQFMTSGSRKMSLQDYVKHKDG